MTDGVRGGCEQEGSLLAVNKQSRGSINNFNRSNIPFIQSGGSEEEGACKEGSGPQVAQATGLIGVWWRFKPRALSSGKQEEL